jgi:hypothetical protein
MAWVRMAQFELRLVQQPTATDRNGAQETVKANDLLFGRPGHNVKVNEDEEI